MNFVRAFWSTCIQLFQFTLSDQSFKGTIVLGDIHKAAATSSTWNPNISFIQMAHHRRSSLYGRGIVNFADNYSLRSHIPLRSCLVGLRLWSDNVNWNSCIPWTAVDMRVKQIAKSVFFFFMKSGLTSLQGFQKEINFVRSEDFRI